MHSLTDEQLMEIFQVNKDGRGKHAFDHLYNRYAKRMVNFFYYSFRNDYAKAQDFLHDLFIKIIENKDKYNANQSFQTWIYRVASNMCKNEFRSNEIVKKYHTHVLNTTVDISSEKNLNKELQVYINSLEPVQRSLIILRFKFDLTVKELANIFECPEGTIKSRLFYATRQLTMIYNK